MLHLRFMLAAAPPSGSAVGSSVIAIAMAIILTLMVAGAIMLAMAVRRTAMGGRDSHAHLRPYIDRARKAGSRSTDAWTEAGRRMPVPPRDAEGERS